MEHARILLWDEMDLEMPARTEEPQLRSLPPEPGYQALPATSRRLYLVRPAAKKGRLPHYV